MPGYYAYITTNPARAVLYIGVTNNMQQRLAQHFQNRGNPETFAGKYFCYNLVYVEQSRILPPLLHGRKS